MKNNQKSLFCVFLILLCSVFLSATASHAKVIDEKDALLGVNEGWAWPVVVLSPPVGWESVDGEAIKIGFRMAEREISIKRDAIRGKEVTFMFSSVKTPDELVSRFKVWQRMKVAVIVSFAGGEIDKTLARICAGQGPSVIFLDGEDIVIRDPATGNPCPYLFALDFSYFGRANALAEFAAQEKPLKHVAVMTDLTSTRLAKGAELNRKFLRARGLQAQSFTVSGYKQDQFVPQVRDAEAGGVRIITSWLDAMATLSIWRTAALNQNGTKVYFAGNQQKLLTDADGLVLVDKDVLLQRNEEGKRDIIVKGRDMFAKEIKSPVIAAKACALGRWVIGAYSSAGSSAAGSIASSLSNVRDIPLMDELLSIDPRTNRPKSRKYGVLEVQLGKYKTIGSVDVYSIEINE